MKGLWNSAKWELTESGLLNWKAAVTLGLWLIYDLNAALSWFGLGAAAYMSFHLLAFAGVAVYQGLKWPFTGAFDLERTSGRPAWQSVLGRTLAWAPLSSSSSSGSIWTGSGRSIPSSFPTGRSGWPGWRPGLAERAS